MTRFNNTTPSVREVAYYDLETQTQLCSRRSNLTEMNTEMLFHDHRNRLTVCGGAALGRECREVYFSPNSTTITLTGSRYTLDANRQDVQTLRTKDRVEFFGGTINGTIDATIYDLNLPPPNGEQNVPHRPFL